MRVKIKNIWNHQLASISMFSRKKEWFQFFGICFSFILRFQMNLGMNPFQSIFCKFKKRSPKIIPPQESWDLKTGGLEIPDPCYTHPNPSTYSRVQWFLGQSQRIWISTEKKKTAKNPPPRDPRATSTGNSKSNGKSKAMTRKGRDSVEPLAEARGVSILTTWRMGFHDLESRG